MTYVQTITSCGYPGGTRMALQVNV